VKSQGDWSNVAAQWHEPLLNAMVGFKGTKMTTAEINKVIGKIPNIGNSAQFIQPSDHCLNSTNRGACSCAETDGAIFEKLHRGLYLVRSPAATVGNSTPNACPAPVRVVAATQGRGDGTHEMWNSNDPGLWQKALNRYWTFVKPSNLALEKEMEQLDAEAVKVMNPQEWYGFLLEKYFRWKYTAPNRYASTTKILRSYAENNELPALHAIKERLFALDKGNIQQCLALASSIRGLGTAGASGLLAVLFPAHFGTIDQFAAKALVKVPELPERDLIAAMNPESLKLDEGAILIRIMRRKASELNRAFSTTEWTPRKVDMVLWTCAR
jgi:hypothetical protein